MPDQFAIVSERQKFRKTPAGLIPIDWDCRTIGEIAEVRYGLGQPPMTDPKGVPIIRATDIKRDKIVGTSLLRVSRESLPMGRNPFLAEGEIIVVRSGINTGDVALITKEWAGSVAGYDLVLTPSPQISPAFCFSYLTSHAAQSYFASESARSAQPHLNAQQLSALAIPLPPITEQKKIAEILRTCNENMQSLVNCATAFRRIKASLLQEFFQHSPKQKKWKMSSIGECATINREVLGEATPPATRIQYLDISSIDQVAGVVSGREMAFGEAPSRARRVVRSGDILVSTVRPYLRAFAKIDQAPTNLIASTGFAVVSPGPAVYGEFLYQFIRSDRFVNFLVERMTGSNYPAVNPGDVAGCPIPLPAIHEQRVIGERLVAVDEALALEEYSRRQLEMVSRGLMSELFSGQKRVIR